MASPLHGILIALKVERALLFFSPMIIYFSVYLCFGPLISFIPVVYQLQVDIGVTK